MSDVMMETTDQFDSALDAFGDLSLANRNNNRGVSFSDAINIHHFEPETTRIEYLPATVPVRKILMGHFLHETICKFPRVTINIPDSLGANIVLEGRAIEVDAVRQLMDERLNSKGLTGVGEQLAHPEENPVFVQEAHMEPTGHFQTNRKSLRGKKTKR